jgi:hypothetical protein
MTITITRPGQHETQIPCYIGLGTTGNDQGTLTNKLKLSRSMSSKNSFRLVTVQKFFNEPPGFQRSNLGGTKIRRAVCKERPHHNWYLLLRLRFTSEVTSVFNLASTTAVHTAVPLRTQLFQKDLWKSNSSFKTKFNTTHAHRTFLKSTSPANQLPTPVSLNYICDRNGSSAEYCIRAYTQRER